MGSELHHDCTNALYAFKSRGFGGEIGVEDFPDYRKGIPTQPPRTKVAAKSRKVSLKDFKFLLGVGFIPLSYSCYEKATRGFREEIG